MLGGWKRSFWHYGDACKGGVLIIAGTLENFKTWAASPACRDESAGVASGRLFVWVKHKPDDEYGYIMRRLMFKTKRAVQQSQMEKVLSFQSGTVYEGELKDTAMESIPTLMVTCTKVNGRTTSRTAMATTLMATRTKVNTRTANNTAVESIPGLMVSVYEGEWKDDKKHGRGKFTWSDERCTKVNGRATSNTDVERKPGLMVTCTKVNGRTARNMDVERAPGLKSPCTKVNTRT